MFEHLDDPHPYAPAPGLRAAVHGQVRRRRRRRVAVAGGVATVAALGVGSVAAVRGRLEPQKIDVGGLAEEAGGPDTPSTAPGDPVTILVVGLDGTEGVPQSGGRDPDRYYPDSMALVRLDPEAGEVRLLTLPRDLRVEVDGVEMRLNQTLPTGGPTRLIQALDQTLGTPVDHYVQIDYRGAQELVDVLGGTRIAVDRPVRDRWSGLALEPGCRTLDGATTVTLARSRFIEVQQDDGSWARDTRSTLGRDLRGAVAAAALLQAAGRIGVADLPDVVRTGLGWVTVDDGLDSEDLVRWARDGRDDRVVTFNLPTVDQVAEDGNMNLRLAADGVDPVVDAFTDGGSDPIAPVDHTGAPVAEATGLRPC